MTFPSKRQHAAKKTIYIVLWVVLICFLQNTGKISLCPSAQESAQQGLNLSNMLFANSTSSMSTNALYDADNPPSNSEDCELSSHLLQTSQSQLENITLTLFIFLLLFIASPTTVISRIPFIKERIVPKNRLHLNLCVFRE